MGKATGSGGNASAVLRRVAVSALIGGVAGAALAIAGEPGSPGTGPLVVLVRHAEKAAEPGGDPPLSAAGRARAEALAAALRDAGVTAVITTQLRRTRETAQPLAEAVGVAAEVVAAGGVGMAEHAAAVAAAVRRHERGVVLVVGHSNSVPAILAALGGPRLPDLCDSAHADLFLLDLGDGTPKFVRALYGAPDPVGGPGCLP